jgi:hypothetical protein
MIWETGTMPQGSVFTEKELDDWCDTHDWDKEDSKLDCAEVSSESVLNPKGEWCGIECCYCNEARKCYGYPGLGYPHDNESIDVACMDNWYGEALLASSVLKHKKIKKLLSDGWTTEKLLERKQQYYAKTMPTHLTKL